MKNKERAIVYSLLAVSIFLGLSRPLSTVVADNPQTEATFKKLTILGEADEPAIVLDADKDGGGRVVVYTPYGQPGLSLQGTSQAGNILAVYTHKAGIGVELKGVDEGSVRVNGDVGQPAIALNSEDAGGHVVVYTPHGRPGLSMEGSRDGHNGLAVYTQEGDVGVGLTAYDKGDLRINYSRGQPGILLECWGQDEERHSKIDMYGGLKDQGPETIMMNGKPVKVARPPSVKLGVSLEAGGWTDNHVITYGPEEKQGCVLRTNSNGESRVEVHGADGGLAVEMSATTVRGKAKATSSNGITVFRPSGEQGIRLGVTDDASGLSISSSEKGADVGLVALFDGRGRVYTRKPDGKPGALLETGKDGSSKLEVYSPDGNVTGHLP